PPPTPPAEQPPTTIAASPSEPARLTALASADPVSTVEPGSSPAVTGPEQRPSLRFLAVGDIMLSRRVAQAMAQRGDLLLPFGPLATRLTAVDFTFGNLESPFSSSDRFSIGPAHNFNTPPAHIQGLVEHRVSVLSLANNHALDQGVAGLRFTLGHLDDHNIHHVGAGMDHAAAWLPAVMERHGIRVGFLGASYAAVNDGGQSRNPYVARIDQRRQLRATITALRPKVDYLVVAMHAGREYLEQIDDAQRGFARQAIDLGADVVFGSHPHVAQAVEIHRGKPIFYSLGNFIFDHEPLATRQGLMVDTTLRATEAADGSISGAVVERMELSVVIIENRSTPRPATVAEASTVLERIGVKHPVILPQETGS
ncbi:MAG: hypothetical protein DRI90_25890, partial [Deltaproteobacteria bacterium]